MLFNSVSFLIFFVAVLVLYWTIPKRFQWLLLLISSFIFYASWKLSYLGLIFFSTAISYLSGILIHKQQQHKNLIVFFAILANLGLLFVFKYFNFFGYSLNSVFNLTDLSFTIPTLDLLLPVGISFYTFQTIGYIIDVYRGVIKPERHFGYFALFVSFFPQLVAGPIERSKNLLPQLRKTHGFNYERTVSGFKLFTLGLFKKLVVADNLAIIVNHVFANLDEFKGLSLIISIILFSWQIYCDFSGYTDMARGVARILGINLVENFRQPYFATSIRDFWRRWHLSLSTWIKDYLYIPLGGSRKGLARTLINYVVVFTLCGLWHGAAWNFVLWGAFHGVVISLEKLVSHLTAGKLQFPRLLSNLYAYGVVCFSWILFRAESPTDIAYFIRYSIVGVKNFITPNYVWASISQMFETNTLEMVIVGISLASIIFIEFLRTNKQFQIRFNSQPILIRFLFYSIVILMIVQLRDSKINEFIYFRF